MELNTIKPSGTWGQASTQINENFSKTSAEVEKLKYSTSKFKGYFSQLSLLTKNIPFPTFGDWAFVGAIFPGVIYTCNVAGTWDNTGNVPDTSEINLSEYAKKEDLSAKQNRLVAGNNIVIVDDIISSTGGNTFGSGIAKTAEKGWFVTDAAGSVFIKFDSDGFDVVQLSPHFKGFLNAAGLSKVYPDFSEYKFYFVGDSITSGVNSIKIYHDYLQDWCGIKTKYNGGVSGDKLIGNMANRILNAGSDVDVVTVFGGTNDWFFNSPIGTPSSASNDGTVCGAVKYIIECSWQRNGEDKPILFFSPIPRATGYGNLEMNNAVGYSLYDLKEAIKTVCHNYAVPFLDQYDECMLKPWTVVGNSTYFSNASNLQGDGLHPNSSGHRILAWRMMWFLQQHLVNSNIE